MELNQTSNVSSTVFSVLTPTAKGTISQTWSSKGVEASRTTIYSLIIIIAFLGNSMLLLTIMLTRRMRTTTNYFLLNMAVGDLLVAVICAPYQLASWEYPFIKTYSQRICKSMPFIQMSTVGVSIFTMLATAVDRYIAVIHPLQRRMTKRLHLLFIFGIWMATIAAAAPMIFVYEVKTIGGPNETSPKIKVCGEFGWQNPSRDAAAYTYALFTLQYALPGVIMAYLYLRIFLNLWFHNIPGMNQMSKEELQRFRKKHYRRKKTVIMLLSVFFAFMLCNLPMHVISFIFYVMGPRFKAPPYMSLVTMSAEMALYSNSALNPILYGFLHNKFKICAKGILRWMFCGGRRPNYDSIQLVAHKSKNATKITFSSSNKDVTSKKISESRV